MQKRSVGRSGVDKAVEPPGVRAAWENATPPFGDDAQRAFV